MNHVMTAGQLWVGSLTVTKQSTPTYSRLYIEEHVREAVSFDYEGDDHPEVSEDFDLTVGEAVVEWDEAKQTVVMKYPATMVIYNTDLPLEDILHTTEKFIRNTITNWYDGLKTFTVSLETGI